LVSEAVIIIIASISPLQHFSDRHVKKIHFTASAGGAPGRMDHADYLGHISSSSSALLPIAEEMSPSVSDVEKEPQLLDHSEWAHLVNSLPLFPPAEVPPPVLYPVLSPLLQQKIGLLSLSRGRNWPALLSWLSPELSFKVHDRLKNAKWRPDGLKQHFRGYRTFDNELVLKPPILRTPSAFRPQAFILFFQLLELTSARLSRTFHWKKKT